DDRVLVFAGEINREAVRFEEIAHLLRELDHDLVQVARRMDFVGDGLELLLESELLRQIVNAGGAALKNADHGRPARASPPQGAWTYIRACKSACLTIRKPGCSSASVGADRSLSRR